MDTHALTAEAQDAIDALIAQQEAQTMTDALEHEAALGFVTDYYRR